MKRCESCGSPIEPAWTEKGARISLDLYPADGGNLEPFESFGGRLIVRHVPAGRGSRVDHRVSCPAGPPVRSSDQRSRGPEPASIDVQLDLGGEAPAR